jgi:hypothetical protein
MPDPIIVQFVQISHYPAFSFRTGFQFIPHYPIDQVDDFRENAARIPMIAVVADHRLKTGRQKAFLFKLQPSRT